MNTTRRQRQNARRNHPTNGGRPSSAAARQARRKRILAIFVIGTLLVGVLAQLLAVATASAHADTTGTSPANGARLNAAPSSVSVTFNEAVGTDARRVQLLDAAGKPVRATFQTSRDKTAASLTPATPLTAGMYALRWSVTSQDGHIVTGASTFSVRTRAAAGRRANVTARATDRGTVTVEHIAGPGPQRLTVTGKTTGALTTIELRHRTLGATLTVPVTTRNAKSGADVVLPYAGAWTVTVIERISEYSEKRYTGTLQLAAKR